MLLMSISSLITLAPPAQSLPEAQIIQKLQEVPVFTITNGSGSILRENIGAGAKARFFTRVFIGLNDAEAFLKSFQKNQPKQGKSAQITPVPMSAIYKLQIDAKQKNDNMSFVFFPTEVQLKNALAILKKPYQSNTVYPVPLFMVAIEQQKNQFVTIQKNKMTPLFFDKEEAQQWLDTVKKQDPKLVSKAQIKVNYLQYVLEDFHAKNYAGQEQLVLIPSHVSMESIRKIQGNQKPSKAPATTAPKK